MLYELVKKELHRAIKLELNTHGFYIHNPDDPTCELEEAETRIEISLKNGLSLLITEQEEHDEYELMDIRTITALLRNDAGTDIGYLSGYYLKTHNPYGAIEGEELFNCCDQIDASLAVFGAYVLECEEKFADAIEAGDGYYTDIMAQNYFDPGSVFYITTWEIAEGHRRNGYGTQLLVETVKTMVGWHPDLTSFAIDLSPHRFTTGEIIFTSAEDYEQFQTERKLIAKLWTRIKPWQYLKEINETAMGNFRLKTTTWVPV